VIDTTLIVENENRSDAIGQGMRGIRRDVEERICPDDDDLGWYGSVNVQDAGVMSVTEVSLSLSPRD
jgi:hypothetical protein